MTELKQGRLPGRKTRWQARLLLALALLLNGLVAAFPTGQAEAATTPGTAYAWGLNDNGQLGNGTTTDSAYPVAVKLPTGVLATGVAAGSGHSLAIGNDGKLYAWGSNTYGQLGNGTTTRSATPLVAKLSTGVAATVAAAGNFSLALDKNGNVYAWGYNKAGQLGDGTTTQRTTPVVVRLPTATAVAAGFAVSDVDLSHSMALDTYGNVYAWGNNKFGQLGLGSFGSSSLTPQMAELPTGAKAIAAGKLHSLALGTDGRVYAWGRNVYGGLGDGTNTDSSFPLAVKLPAGVSATAIAAGGYFSLAIGSDGKLYAWGDNYYGQLGDGTNTGRTTPVVVKLPTGVKPTAIAAGTYHSLAIGSDGKLYAWGSGLLGGTPNTPKNIPAVVMLPTGVKPIAIAAGLNYSLAIVQ